MLYMEYSLEIIAISKLQLSINMNVGQDPIDVEPLVQLRSWCNGKCLLVVHNEGLTELGEGISQYQDVPFTIY